MLQERQDQPTGRAKGSASCNRPNWLIRPKYQECLVLPLSCLGICQSPARSPFPILVRAEPFAHGFSNHPSFRTQRSCIRAFLSSVPAKDPVQVKPRLLYFYFWVCGCALLQSHRVGTSNWLVGPANRSVLHDPQLPAGAYTRREFKPPLVADFVKRRFAG